MDHARALVEREGAAVFLAPGGVPIRFDHEGVVAIVGDAAEVSAWLQRPAGAIWAAALRLPPAPAHS